MQIPDPRPNFIEAPAYTLGELQLYPHRVPRGIERKVVSLQTPLSRFRPDSDLPRRYLNAPIIGAVMQSLAGPELLAGIAKQGGIGFIPSSIPIEDALELYAQTKKVKAGFVDGIVHSTEEMTLEQVLAIEKDQGYSTIPILDGRKLKGIVTGDDYWPDDNPKRSLREVMTPFVPYKTDLPVDEVNYLAEDLHKHLKAKDWDNVQKKENSPEYKKILRIVKNSPFVYGVEGLSLKGANLLLRISKKSCLPIVDKENNLVSLVFKKDYIEHADNPMELTDAHMSPEVGIGLNTRDYQNRIKAAIDAKATVFCFDSSTVNGYQIEALEWARKEFPRDKYPNLVFGGGNVVEAILFRDLAEAGADFIKVGIGGGAICITREQQAVGVGQGSAVRDVAAARYEYFENTKTYIPIISDGGIVYDHDIIIALALGADAVMMGRYFARFEENPWETVKIRGVRHKPYWGEGSLRAKNWARYGQTNKDFVVQGVDGYVPLVGPVKEGVEDSMKKLRKTMVDYLGALNMFEFVSKARVRPGSMASVQEGSDHDIIRATEAWLMEDIGLRQTQYKTKGWGS
ncbi:MAG: IMP dehydrogenase [Nanoarchaeota archaeon]|nr:IMP dehydrogenase [Nanoarchaeota archaeon]